MRRGGEGEGGGATEGLSESARMDKRKAGGGMVVGSEGCRSTGLAFTSCLHPCLIALALQGAVFGGAF